MVTALGSHVVIPADMGEVVVLALPPPPQGGLCSPRMYHQGKMWHVTSVG